jgi:transposase
VRDFTRATGRLAKTDEIDAVAILRFADAMHPPASPVPSPDQVRLTELIRRRRQLVDAAAQEKQREPMHGQPFVTSSVERHLAFLATEIAALDQAIADAIEADGMLARRAELLRSIPGVGVVTAATLVAELPELGTTGNKQIAALTGVAPMNRDSGMSRGQAHIAGGRMSARCCLYMATIVAIRCNPAIRPFYKRLREQGKPPKVAIVAAMRKLITTANAMLAHDRPWHADPA